MLTLLPKPWLNFWVHLGVRSRYVLNMGPHRSALLAPFLAHMVPMNLAKLNVREIEVLFYKSLLNLQYFTKGCRRRYLHHNVNML
jgi:hypothetical protein